MKMSSHPLIQIFFILGLFNTICCRNSSNHTKYVNAKLLATMQSYMDPTADPCQDFYTYACGNWGKIHQNFTKYVDTVGSLDYVINHRVRVLLKDRNFKKKAKTNMIYRKIREYHKSCEEQRNFDALYYLQMMRPREDTEWPEVMDYGKPSNNEWNIWHIFGRLQAVGFTGFPMTLNLKPFNATYFQLELDKIDLFGYTAYEQKLLDDMEGSLSVKSRKLAEDIQNLIEELMELHKTQKEFGWQEMTIGALREEITTIDFRSYFKEFLETDDMESLIIKVYNFSYFVRLGEIMRKISPDTLIHTIRLKFLGYLEKIMPNNKSNLKCLNHMRDLVPLALDFMYEQEIYRYERNTSDIVIRKVFRTMQETFRQIIKKHSQEFSVDEITFLQNKIMHMQLNIGNLPLVRNQQFYFHYFKSWKVMQDNFYWNHLSALRHYYSEKYKLLSLKNFSPYHTFFSWTYGSPAYQPSSNLLIIPHAYLRFPVFHPRFHDLFLYAELGNTLGHEMLHAFDMNGLKYDGAGNPSMKIISSLMDNTKFLSNLQCLQEQRPSSINELIADFSGFHLAYGTYFDGIGPTEYHGNTSLSNRQLFFIKFAQFFCAISPSYITYDESHDTPFRRVPEVVRNHQDFEEVFQCPAMSSKRAVKKCQLW